MLKKFALAASAIVIGLGTITPAMAGGSHGQRHFQRGHHSGHHGHAAGYAILGFGLGYLLYSASRQRSTYYGNPYYRNSGYYYPPPQYRAPANYYIPPPAQSAQEVPTGTTCLQTREYTTVITMGGEEHEAYGTACLQEDGTWIAGAPKIIPTFD